MEETAFNYSCKPVNPNPKCGTILNMPDMKSADRMPVLQQCTMLVKIQADIYNIKIEFCQNVMLVHNTESNTRHQNNEPKLYGEGTGRRYNPESVYYRRFLSFLLSIILDCLFP
jgi:hypothetical protein